MMNMPNNNTNNTQQGGAANNAPQQAQAREKKYLEVEKVPFDGILKTKITTTVKLAQMISGMFKGAIADFDGTILLPNQQGGFDVTLFFKENKNVGNNQIQAIRPIGSGNRTMSAPIQRLQTFNQRTANKAYELTEDIKDILSEFIYVKGNKPINWGQIVAEQSEQLNYQGGYQIYVTVGGLDIIRLIRKIYGGKEGNARIDYNINMLKPVGANITGFNQNFLINIQQLDNSVIEELAKEAGLVPVMGAFPIIR